MKTSREFEIAWQGMKEGLHTFEYEVDQSFIEAKSAGNEILEGLQAHITVQFEKTVRFFLLRFEIFGSLEAACDRCGDPFELKIWDDFDLIIKLSGEEAAEVEEDADVIYMSRSETVIDLSDWIYEYVLLSIPIQKIHPLDEQGHSTCNEAIIQKLNALNEEQAKDNPLWKGLAKLKDQVDPETQN